VPESPILVIGVGNALRGDDGAGAEVVRRLRERAVRVGIEVSERLCEPADLLEAWQDRNAVVLVDTMRSGQPTGTIRRFDVSREPLPARWHGSTSSHAFELHAAIELGRALNRLPRRAIVYAVEGGIFDAGAALSDQVQAAVGHLAAAVLEEASALADEERGAVGRQLDRVRPEEL
jgi:hydrogenase maturation protease